MSLASIQSILILFIGIFCVLSTAEDHTSSFICEDDKFKCASQRCIAKEWRCDGDDDCGDGSDEIDCMEPKQCLSDIEFRCDNKLKCIPLRWKCDHERDCNDGSDEVNCTKPICEKNFFQCSNNRCIPNRWHCDGADDCGDKSDEKNCTVGVRTCSSEEFRCNDGSCINYDWKCDGNQDCLDNSDETDCGKEEKTPCTASEFTCEKQCVPHSWRCDGTVDCHGGEDEANCTVTPTPRTCVPGQWTCKDGGCISNAWKCDGDKDCRDESDEKECKTVQCSFLKFACKNHKQCIFLSYRCNGQEDCDDGSDELDCPKRETVCTGMHFNCSDGTCIDESKVCDYHNNCPHGEDEPVSCFINECRSQQGHCMHTCVDLKIGFKCTCRDGYTLDDDGRSCLDVNECNFYGTCHQKCENTKGSYKCSCAEGFQLEPDQKTCKVNGAEPIVYFSNRQEIRTLTKDGDDYQVAVSQLKGVVSFDFHVGKNYIYMADAIDETIKKAELGKPYSVEVVLKNVHTPDGLAVDWVTGKLYWTDTGYKTIEVADLDGKHNADLLAVGLSEPRAIALDPTLGYIYWTDWGEEAAIERISMDGDVDTRIKLVHTDIQWPNGLTLDLAQRKMYWIDAKLRRVEVADLLGNNRKVIKDQGIIHPFAMDNFEEMLYWTDWRLDGVRSLNKFDTRTVNTLRGKLYAPMDIKIYHTSKQKSEINPCGSTNNGCSHLCLLSNTHGDREVTCKCPRNMTLHRDGKTCVGTAVTRAPFTTTTVSPTTNSPITTTEKVTTTETTIQSTKRMTSRSTKSATTLKPTKKVEKTTKKHTSHQQPSTQPPKPTTKKPPTSPKVKSPEKTTHPLKRTTTIRPSVEVEQNAPAHDAHKDDKRSLGSGLIAAIIVVLILVILLSSLGFVYCRRRGIGKRQVMYYKDMSTQPLEDDFDLQPEEMHEKAKIVSNE